MAEGGHSRTGQQQAIVHVERSRLPQKQNLVSQPTHLGRRRPHAPLTSMRGFSFLLGFFPFAGLDLLRNLKKPP